MVIGETFSMSSLVILAASVFFKYLADKQTNVGESSTYYLATAMGVANKYAILRDVEV